jgi:CubicO group peptidase (beta-lactamase class C family)
MQSLRLIDDWGASNAAAGVLRGGLALATYGDTSRCFALASVTKLLVAYAALVGVEEGTVDLDAAAGPPGSTVRHLLGHASGLGFDGTEPPSPVGTRRIYSNAGFEALGDHLAAAWAMPVATYLREAVLEPLGLLATALEGSPAHGARSSLDDLVRFAAELARPTLVSPTTLAAATTVQMPGLAGVLPGFGRQTPCDWGLGFELRAEKRPHWTGRANSPATFGHFGASGTFVWVDPLADVALVVLTDRDFGPWATEAWPRLADDVLAEAR